MIKSDIKFTANPNIGLNTKKLTFNICLYLPVRGYDDTRVKALNLGYVNFLVLRPSSTFIFRLIDKALDRQIDVTNSKQNS